MKKLIYILILLVSLLYASIAYPANHNFQCAKSKDVMKKNLLDGYAYFATATENTGFVIQLYINIHNGDWRIVGIDNNLNACNMLQGIEFEFFKVVSM